MSESVLSPSPNNDQIAAAPEGFAEYGLTSDPFDELSIPTVAADDSYSSGFFMGAERRAVLDEMIHLCQFGNNLVALLGVTGVGKTALVHQAMLELRETAKCCLVDASTVATVESVFAEVITSLDISLSPDATAGEMLAAVRQHVPVDEHRRIVMIVDDAHYLDDQILAAIVSLLQGQQSYHLHVLLAGDDSLASRLDKFEMVDVLIYDIALRSFRMDELDEYLDFKLDLAGYQGDSLFEESDITELWRYTEGLPAAINNAARDFLLSRLQPSDEGVPPPPSPSLPIWHMVVIGVLLVALIMALFYMGGDDAEEAVAKNDATVPAVIIAAEPQPASTPLNADATRQVKAPDMGVVLPKDIPAREDSAKQVLLPKNGVALPSVGDELIPALEGHQAASNKQVPNADAVTVPPLVKAPVVSPNNQAAKPIALPRPIDVPDETHKKPAPVVSVGLNADEQQVMVWPAAGYTLQVMAAGQLKGVEAFVKRQPNGDDLRIVRVLREQQPWYIVLVGTYDDSLAARLAIQSLPQTQVNAGPWPRKISDIQLKMREFSRR